MTRARAKKRPAKKKDPNYRGPISRGCPILSVRVTRELKSRLDELRVSHPYYYRETLSDRVRRVLADHAKKEDAKT